MLSNILKSVTILDVSEFLYTHIVPKLDIVKCKERVIVHKQCKIKKAGKEKYIELLARSPKPISHVELELTPNVAPYSSLHLLNPV